MNKCIEKIKNNNGLFLHYRYTKNLRDYLKCLNEIILTCNDQSQYSLKERQELLKKAEYDYKTISVSISKIKSL